MRDILRKSKPQRLDDLIALNALYRPGPLRSGMVDDYIARKQGKTEIKYDLPELEPILNDTYGVIAYQEQVMRISNVVAGFTLGEADLLRKAMGKKNAEVMAKMRGKFVEGAKKLGTPEKKGAPLFDLMAHFAGYGFNKSHSTAYAFLAYQTAYLKANYPWHFAAALLTIEAANTDKLALYLGECRDRQIPVLPPDINRSQLRFTVEPDRGVRFGLTAIKNVGEGAIESLLGVRARQGRIKSLESLCEDLDLRLVNKRVFESLTKAGAFDSLAEGTSYDGLPTLQLRPRILAAVDTACEYGARAQRDKEQGQGGLFGPSEDETASASGHNGVTLPEAAPWTETEQLGFEKETLGLYWSGHPVDRYADALKLFGAKSVADLAEAQPAPDSGDSWGPGGRKPMEADTSVGGIVAACRQLKTRKGDKMAVFTLEDALGGVEIVVFPEAYSRAAPLIESGTLVLVRGKLERDEETVRILATEIAPLESVRERLAREVAIHLKRPADRGMLESLGEIFSRHRGDRKVSFEVETGTPGNRLRVRVEVSSQIRVRPSPSLISDIEQIVGAGSVELR
jgi:DNA polymerase-3 subunit alpha